MDEIETELFRLSRPYDEVIKRISRIAGFTERSALFVISEIGADMGVLNRINISVPGLVLPLRIMRVPTKRNLPVVQKPVNI